MDDDYIVSIAICFSLGKKHRNQNCDQSHVDTPSSYVHAGFFARSLRHFLSLSSCSFSRSSFDFWLGAGVVHSIMVYG